MSAGTVTAVETGPPRLGPRHSVSHTSLFFLQWRSYSFVPWPKTSAGVMVTLAQRKGNVVPVIGGDAHAWGFCSA